MKNNIKTILAALIMLLSGAVTAFADTKNAGDYVKLTKSTLTVEEPYFEFEYPDRDYDGIDDAIVNVEISINYNNEDLLLGKMYRCQDEMERMNRHLGALQIFGERRDTDKPDLRLVKVRYYPSFDAIIHIKAIKFKARWDTDDNEPGIGDYDINETMNVFQNKPDIRNREMIYDDKSHSGNIDFDGTRFHVNNYKADNMPGGWVHKVRICDNPNYAFWGDKTYFDGNKSDNGHYDLVETTFAQKLDFYLWNYVERKVKVKNGSYKKGEPHNRMQDEIEVYQKASASTPLILEYRNYLGRVTECTFNRIEQNGSNVLFIKGNKDMDVDIYRTSRFDTPTLNDYIGTISINSSNATKFIDRGSDPYEEDLTYTLIPWDRSWTQRSILPQKYCQNFENLHETFNLEGEGTDFHPYKINNEADFRSMRFYVNNGKSKGKNIHWILCNDIVFTSAGDNLMFETGTDAHKFDGVFDGNGHTITVNVNGNNKGTRALFGKTSNAVIKNLKVTGTINVNEKFGAGFVSSMFGGTISNCWSDVTINSTVNGDGTHGGFLGTAEKGSPKCEIKDCVFTGSISGTGTNACGGFVGWSNQGTNTLKLTNCLNLGSYNLNTLNCDAFARNGAQMQNCYYLNALGSNLTNATRLTESHKGFGLLDNLGTGTYSYREGEYPALKTLLAGAPDFALDASSKLTTTKDFADVDITLTRNFYAGERCTMMLPFDVDANKAAELGKFYTYSKILPASGRVVFTPVAGGLKANTPYVMEAAQTVSSLTFDNVTLKATAGNPDASKAPATTKLVGTTKPVTVPTGAYGYSAGDTTHDRGSFVKVGNNVTLPAFCAYLWINGGTAKTMEAVFTDEDGDITGIETLYQDEENPSIYSLDGRKLDKPERGINIINGKKVVIR